VSELGELGDLLKNSREQLGLSLEDIEASTCIKRVYLQALEAEDFDSLPSSTVARGFLRNYAATLKLDVDYVLELYLQGESSSAPGRMLPRRAQYQSIPMIRPSRFTPDLFIGFLLITALLGGILYIVYRLYLLPLEMAPITGPPTPTSEAAIALPTPTLVPTNTPTPTVTPTPLYYTGVTVELIISQESWVQVLVDGVKTFEGKLQPGEQPHWIGERQVAVRAGNAGGVEVIVNGESMGLMGEPGQVVDQVWAMVEGQPVAPEPSQDSLTPTPMP
jgi:cytoskeletal protein RodZ